ncbi:MAG: hypothetical protein KJ706_01630 [Candidatus Omnitrophica bacterium]|nr:hypothetical protein [Candidatus Omnitrophota bacterium]MBU4589459.1 hypothetical protein [Candidatus Omnitrophota bacterium]
MAKCSKGKELIITTENKVGMLAEVTSAITGQGVNISAVCAYSMEGNAIFMLLTSDDKKAKSAAASKGWKVEESDVVVVELADKIGAVKEIADKLKAKGVNLHYIYGTTCTCSPDCASRLVLKAEDSDALVSALK